MIRVFKHLTHQWMKCPGGFFSALLLSAMFTGLFTATATAMDKNIQKAPVQNQSDEIDWQPLSTATATWMWLDIYEASLFATVESLPKDFLSDEVPLKLSLCYLKPISSDIFIEGASEVLSKELSPSLRAEVDRLHQSYQAVEPGDCYALEYTVDQGTALKLNGKPIFNSNQMGFKAVYFGIWLGDHPLSEALKTRLLATQSTSK